MDMNLWLRDTGVWCCWC